MVTKIVNCFQLFVKQLKTIRLRTRGFVQFVKQLKTIINNYIRWRLLNHSALVWCYLSNN